MLLRGPTLPTQEDPSGVAGGVNLYGYAGGDPINNHDPFGLDVVFRGDEDGAVARRAWNDLKAAARAGLRDNDRGTQKAARALLGVLNSMERDTETTFHVEIGAMSSSFLNATGGGIETCSGTTPNCSVVVATNGLRTGVLTSLAHEAGGAWGSKRGVTHADMTGATQWENAARRLFGCSFRADHGQAPTACR
jgi:uncharacterized protein RhaS with RHS repeats